MIPDPMINDPSAVLCHSKQARINILGKRNKHSFSSLTGKSGTFTEVVTSQLGHTYVWKSCMLKA